jgi:hypothetical protein
MPTKKWTKKKSSSPIRTPRKSLVRSSPKKTPEGFPKYSFSPILLSPDEIKKSPPKKRKQVEDLAFDFESNIEYSSAQPRTPLVPIENIFSPRTLQNISPIKRKTLKPKKLKFETILLPTRGSKKSSSYEATQTYSEYSRKSPSKKSYQPTQTYSQYARAQKRSPRKSSYDKSGNEKVSRSESYISATQQI